MQPVKDIPKGPTPNRSSRVHMDQAKTTSQGTSRVFETQCQVMSQQQRPIVKSLNNLRIAKLLAHEEKELDQSGELVPKEGRPPDANPVTKTNVPEDAVIQDLEDVVLGNPNTSHMDTSMDSGRQGMSF
ncbi:IS putative transposase [Sesbania bispinosa]|nr:IS putative transposase [Sesbania bispinosa]